MNKRFTAWLLCLCLLFTLVPVAAFGEEVPAEAPAAEVPATEVDLVPATETGETASVDTAPATSGEFWKIEEKGGIVLTITQDMDYTGDVPWLAWKDSISRVVIAEGVTAIPEKAFAGLSLCSDVFIPASVASIGNNAFLDMGTAFSSNQRIRLYTGYTKEQVEDWDKATCEKYGLVYGYRTSVIYDHYDEDAHEYVPFEVPSTCTEPGLKGLECRCDVTKDVEDLPLAEHTPVDVAEKAPTDTEEGYTAGTKCSACGTVLSGCETIAPTATNSGTLKTDTAAGKGKGKATWTISDEGVLHIFGEGTITDEQPWTKYRPVVTKIVIDEGITGLPVKAFRKFANCFTVCLPLSCTSIGSGAFTGMGSSDANTAPVLYTAHTKESAAKLSNIPEEFIVAYEHYDPDKHTAKTVARVEPTCSTVGKTEGAVCAVCQKVLVEQKEIDTLPHTEVTIPGKAATCTEKGLTDGKKCTVCETVTVKQKEIAELPHTPVDVAEKLPTSTEDGHTAGTKCSVCGTVLTGCDTIKAAYSAYSGVVLTDDGNAQWVLFENGALTISDGKGNVKEAPWLAYEKKIHIKTVVVSEGITGLADGSFKDCDRLTTVSLPKGLVNIGAETFYGCEKLTAVYLPDTVTAIGDKTFYKCSKLATLTMGNQIKSIGDSAFYYCKEIKTLTLPSSLETIGANAFQKCSGLTSLIIPDSVTLMGSGAFAGCTGLTKVSVGTGLKQIKEETFSGDKAIKEFTLRNTLTVVRDAAFKGCSKLETVYYYGTESQWKETVVGLNNESLTGARFVYLYKETVANKVTLSLSGTSLEGKTVYIDGVAYAGEDGVKGDKVSITLPNKNAKTAVIYTWNKTGADVDTHEKYPTAMYVWTLSQEGGMYVSQRNSALDNVLVYAGSSIRITGKKGIRMITGVPKSVKTALTGSKGYNGYTLEEYGTIVAWVDELKGSDLTLSSPAVKGGQAYSKTNKKDAVYKKTGDQIQYTNVLVGFTEEQCKPDLAMRPYIILKDASGQTITLYGGTVERSIGYIAYQNRAAFKSGTTSYEYIWSIIHAVYGDKYDADYQR